MMILERDTCCPLFPLSVDYADYIDALYKNLRKRLGRGYDEKNFRWVLGSEVIQSLVAYYGKMLGIPLISYKEGYTLYNIRVEENRANPYAIQIYEDVTEFLERN